MFCIFVDINECSRNTHSCSQVCVNDIGTYHCECFTGYKKLARSRTDVTCTGTHTMYVAGYTVQ